MLTIAYDNLRWLTNKRMLTNKRLLTNKRMLTNKRKHMNKRETNKRIRIRITLLTIVKFEVVLTICWLSEVKRIQHSD